MTNDAERVLDAEAAANALVAELARLKTAAESLETAHADSEQATQTARDVVTTLNDVMPAIARVLAQLQALDLPALIERLAGEITASGTELRERIAGEIQDVTEPLNQAATRLETLPIEPTIRELDGRTESLQTSLASLEALPAEIAAIQEAQGRVEPALQDLDGKAAALLQRAADAAAQHERSGAQVQTSLAKLESLPADVAAVQEAQGRVEPALQELDGKAAAAAEAFLENTAGVDALQDALVQLRQLRSLLAHAPSTGQDARTVRPAYSLDDGDHG